MDSKESFHTLAAQRQGVLKTSDVVAAGLSKKALAEFVRENGFEKASHGLYCDPGAWRDDMLLLQLRCPKTVFSHETALFLHGLTDQEPLHYTVTAKTGYNPAHLSREGIKVHTVKKELFELGLTTAPSPFGNPIKVYSRERTICDVIRSRSSVETRIWQEALKHYAGSGEKNLLLLMEYAERFHVDRILHQYMEVLL